MTEPPLIHTDRRLERSRGRRTEGVGLRRRAREALLAACATGLILLVLAGCGPATDAAPGSPPSVAVNGRVTGPEAEARCTEARQIILTRTSEFSAAFQATSKAVEQGDEKAARAHFATLRDGLNRWADDLDRTAAQTRSPALAGVFTEYAGSLRAVMERAPSIAKLDKLYTFSETQLDLSADQFARSC
jgi:hypothetical protein